jgi:hypothetical protein
MVLTVPEKFVRDSFTRLYRYNTRVSFTFNKNFTKEDFFKSAKKYFKENEKRKLFMKIGKINYTFSAENLQRINKAIEKGYVYNRVGGVTFSDAEYIEKIETNIRKINIVSYLPKKYTNKRQGGFFKYYINDKFLYDFIGTKKYGIHYKFGKGDLIDNCFVESLIASKVMKKEVLDYVRGMVKSRMIPLATIKKIAEEGKVYIEISTLKKKIKYGNPEHKKIHIGLIEEHYFFIEQINVTSYALKNYKELKHKNKWNEYVSKKQVNKERFISSFELFKILLENKEEMLTNITLTDDIYKTQYFDQITTIPRLEYDERCVEKVKPREIKRSLSELPIVFFDCETTTNGKNHEVYLICACFYDGNGNHIRNSKYRSADEFIYNLREDSLVIAHNLGYDFRFITESPRIRITNIIDKGQKIMSVSANVTVKKKIIKLHFKDSNFLITERLASFPAMFNIKGEKEVMPYELYTQSSVTNKRAQISRAIKIINDDEKAKQFMKNLEELKLIDGLYFDHMKYSEFYCQRDCEILAQGYYIFRKWIKEITKLDINDYISLPSIADNFLINKKCYSGVYNISGNVRQFIQSSLVGGRCMTRSNKKYHLEKRLQDFDAVSLYPSAMYRMEGFLKGKPKVLDTTDYTTISKYDGYFIEVKFNRNVGKKLKFPLLSAFEENGSREFTNVIKGKTFIVDKVMFEDVLRFHEVKDFEIIRGYYFDEGFNKKIKKEIKKLYDTRNEKKKEGNKIEKVYKLLMNAVYGKTIMKPIDTENKVMYGENKCMDHVYRNSNFIKYYCEIGGNKWMIKKIKPINNHFSRPHIGCSILSWSKRIMNEVMCLAEDNDIKIYYQDTDSMHIEEDKIEKLKTLFREKYNRELDGEAMGQFHCDFSVDKDKNSPMAVSVESFFLGKKCYIDKLEFIKGGKIKHDYHIRLKGIPNDSITAIGEPMETYSKLYDGEAITFDLLESGCKFEFTKDFKIHSKEDFKRKVKF